MRLRGRALGEWMLLTAVLVAIAALSSWQGWLWRADQLLYDTGLSLASRTVPDDIVIVAIDEESLARIGRWPWRRAIHATLIEKLTQAEAAAVGMDIILSEPDARDPNGDRVLAEAIRRNGRVVLPVVPRPIAPGALAEGLPIELLRQYAAELGHIEIPLDADGIARGVYLWGGVGAPRYPQFALAMLKVSDGGTPIRYAKPAAPAPDAASEAAWQRSGWLHPQFAGPPGAYKTVSYVDVLTGTTAREAGAGGRHGGRAGRPLSDANVRTRVGDVRRRGPRHAARRPARQCDDRMVAGGRPDDHHRRDDIRSHGRFAVPVAARRPAPVGRRWHRRRRRRDTAAPVGPPLGAAEFDPARCSAGVSALELAPAGIAQRFMDAELQQLHEIEPGTTADVPAERNIDPLENRIAIVRAAAERQREIQKVRDDTMRFISHDIRSPLASIITLVDGAANQAGADNAGRLRRAGHYAQNALNLADDFFRLAKAETIDARKFEDVDLSSLAQEAADEVWPQAERKQILILIRDEGSRDPLVRGDRAQLNRALTNLLNNAIKFSPEATSIHLTLRDDGRWQEIAVADQGCGIAQEDIGKLFMRYGRIARPERPAQSGIGLGLVIVKTIIERHGGTVALDSSLGTGSTFRLRLPHALPDNV
jgi:signal transduction histidine kinase